MHGVLYHYEGDPAESDGFLKRAIEAEPSIRCAWFYIGKNAFGRGDYDAATAAFRRELELAPRSELTWTCHLHLAWILVVDGQGSEALKELRLADETRLAFLAATSVDDDILHWLSAGAYEALGRWEDEAAELEAIESPDNVPEHPGLQLSQVYILLKEYEKADEVCGKLIASGRDELVAAGYGNRAYIASLRGDGEEALAEIKRALDVLPKYPPTLSLASTLEGKHGDLAMASSYAFEYIKQLPEDQEGWSLYVRAMRAQGGPQKAVEFLGSMGALYPNSRWRLYYLVQLHKELTNEDKALSCLAELRQLDAEFAQEHFPDGE